jgi:hypothetical protein
VLSLLAVPRRIFAGVGLFLACAPGPRAASDACPGVAIERRALAEKAEHFDDVAIRWHIRPGQDLLNPAVLAPDLTNFARVGDVRDNTGMWTSMYTASQAFRYAVTKSSEARENVRRALHGERDLMRITGVLGLFARSAVDPSLPGFPSASELLQGFEDCNLSVAHCKTWIEVQSGEFAGHLFKNDTSKDEYAGHLFALGVVADLVLDDDEIRATVRDLLDQIGSFFIDNRLLIKDVDGKITTYGDMNAQSVTDYPGFNAVLMLSWMRIAASVTGSSRFAAYYDGCLLHRPGAGCETPEIMTIEPYDQLLDSMGLDLGCLTNWNNHNMAQLSMWGLIRHENDPAQRARYRQVLEDQLWNAEPSRPIRAQQISLFTFFYEGNRSPDAPRPDAEIDQAVCTLERYPAEKYLRAVDLRGKYPVVCEDRLANDLTDQVIPVDQRPTDNFIWRNPPYRIETAAEDRTAIESPEDFLLAYWLGRYLGLLAEDD